MPQIPVALQAICAARIFQSVFVPFAWFYMNQPLKLDYLWVAICILGAVYFMFRT